VVVLDSPPVAIVSDAAVLSSVVDVTLLVVRAGRTSRDAVEHAVDTLNRSGGRVAGAVLNDASRAYADVYGGYYVEGSAPPPLERGQGSREPLGGQEPSAS